MRGLGESDVLAHDGHDDSTPAPWSPEEIDYLVELAHDQDTAPARLRAAWKRDQRRDDLYEDVPSDSRAIFVVNLGDRPGYLDETDDLSRSFMILEPP